MSINLKEIHKYVEKHQAELSSLKAYFNKYEENSINSAKIIVEINDEIKKNLKSVSKDKPTFKTIKQFSQNIEQKQASQKMAQFVREKIKMWFQPCETVLGNIKQKLREIDMKHQKKQLTQKQVIQFKEFLTESIFSFHQNKEAILGHFCNLQISQNALLLQSLTNKIQRIENK